MYILIANNYTELLKMITGMLTTCHTHFTSFYIYNPMWFLSMELRQGSGLCSSSSRKYPGTEGCYMLQRVGKNSIIVLIFVESRRVHIQSTCKVCNKNLERCSIR